MTFTPAINPLSRALGRSATTTDLHHDHKLRQRSREAAQKKIERQVKEECSFQPKINKYPISGSSQLRSSHESNNHNHNNNHNHWFDRRADSNPFDTHMIDIGCPVDEYCSADSNISNRHPPRTFINITEPDKMSAAFRQRELEKEEKRRSALIEKEILELKECTFHPRLPPAPPSYISHNHHGTPVVTPAAPVIVRGLGRHLELQMMSQQKKKDEADRQRQAFSVNIKNMEKLKNSEDGTTIVKPFQLATAALPSRESRAVVETVAREEQQLTFAPHRAPLPSYTYDEVARFNKHSPP